MAEVFLTHPGFAFSIFFPLQPVIVPFSSLGLYALHMIQAHATLAILAYGDPSVCYRLELHNPLTDAVDEFGNQTGNVFFNIDLPIPPLGANSVSATLDIDLVDSNGDGTAFLARRAGFAGMQRAYSFVPSMPDTTPPIDLGLADLNAPGHYSFAIGPTAGSTVPAEGETTLIATFILSPGDTALVRGKIVQDDASGAPICEIPGLAFVTGCSDPDAILGTPDNDVLEGTPGDDILCGGAGSDRIYGMGGNDRIFGGPGRDQIEGGAGRDLIHGEDGNDVVCGDSFAGEPSRAVGKNAALCLSGGPGSANDTIFGDEGDDFLGGGPGADSIHGGNGRDRISGGEGRDKLHGDDGKDRLAGGSHKDTIRGGADADRLLGDEGDDRLLADDGVADALIDGGEGTDAARVDPDLDIDPASVEIFLP